MSSGRTAWVWTPERESLLRDLWGQGLSAAQCAAQLGEITRSGVLGKAMRMALARRRAAHVFRHARRRGDEAERLPMKRPKPRRPRKAKAKRKAGHSNVNYRMRLLAEVLPGDTARLRGDAWAALPGTAPVTLMEVRDGMCRWPVGESKPFLFCGLVAVGAYCEQHSRLSWRATP